MFYSSSEILHDAASENLSPRSAIEKSQPKAMHVASVLIEDDKTQKNR